MKLKKIQLEKYKLLFICKDKKEILATNIDTLTPIEALVKLNEIKRMLVEKNISKD